MQDLKQIFKGKRVFLTGHTGFKGAWLLLMLQHFGAIVKGYALAPEQDNDLYHQINGDELCYTSVIDDIRNANTLQGELIRFEPDFVFHLAAQALVRKSYEIPVDTFATNVMGTINVLEAIRHLDKACVGIMVTTDKVYENNESGVPFKESDKLGGYDPYSASKAACELAISSYINSYFNTASYDSHQKSIVAMRAGNVIGGGDFSSDRIIPDIVRAIQQDVPVQLRNPKAVRPWQHVIEPLYAYLQMAACLQAQPTAYAKAYNIGPEAADVLEVQTVTELFIKAFGKGTYTIPEQVLAQPHEAHLLLLDNSLIKKDIGFSPKLNALQAIQWTADWYADKTRPATEKCIQQIDQYFAS
ncbi:CDP-glucose 4,6-dehydratase [Taibaiella sp. KBW10]|uniref:CDP-glucose 4,6-dehydratase n=1 Tax=Taibaiella sp. KBW10 TaxID=2153357 RepID=UPI000F59EB48|nr:CDP-glucose 4,6-dehydratase [Taibaiella sp. KBW10]RQO31562.1 CDP-glucose 4,6-dehydratase [Taibaiella sp. KBW10]